MAKTGAAFLLQSLVPGLDIEAIEKTASGIGQQVIAMAECIQRMEHKLDEANARLLRLELKMDVNAVPELPELYLSVVDETLSI